MLSLLTIIITITLLAAFFGAVLGYASVKFKVESDPIVDQIDNLLPQTQCGQCGYPGCRPYAQAIANGDAINKCPPGGQVTIEKLADLMGVEATESVHELDDDIQTVAYIDESMCIGCTKCIAACPVDAIVGSKKSLHTVIVKDCTGCDLCVAPCPTDCISMIPIKQTTDNWGWDLNSIPFKDITPHQTENN